ncbi:MAG: GntP family permease, partial [Clostridiales bacterium]|nr:GntP family permease [Clostridiales bacterium]
VALGTADGVAVTIFDTFAGGVGQLVSTMFFLFTAAGLLGYLMQETGASLSIGNKFVKLLGVDKAPYILAITTTVLLVAGVGTYIFVMVVLAAALMEAANLPRRIGLISCLGIAPAISFCMPVPNVPNSLPGIFLGTSPFGAPVLSVATGLVGIVLFFFYLRLLVKQARKLNLGYDGPRSKGADGAEEANLPPFGTSIAALAVVVAVAIALSNLPAEAGISATAAVALAQLAGCIVIIACNWKLCKEKIGFVNMLSKGASGMWPFLVLAGCVMGFGLVIQKTACFQTIIDWVFGLKFSPYVSAMISVAIVAGLCADGITAMMMWLPIFGQQYIAMGVNPQALHRLLVSTTQTFDSLPHSQSTAISLSVFGLTHKEAYKDVFVTTVIIPVVFSIFCCIMSMIFYPIA